MELNQGDCLTIRDTEEETEVKAQVLAAVLLEQRQYVMLRIEEDEEDEAFVLRLQKEEAPYRLQSEAGQEEYGDEPDEEEWNRALQALEKESEYIFNE